MIVLLLVIHVTAHLLHCSLVHGSNDWTRSLLCDEFVFLWSIDSVKRQLQTLMHMNSEELTLNLDVLRFRSKCVVAAGHWRDSTLSTLGLISEMALNSSSRVVFLTALMSLSLSLSCDDMLLVRPSNTWVHPAGQVVQNTFALCLFPAPRLHLQGRGYYQLTLTHRWSSNCEEPHALLRRFDESLILCRLWQATATILTALSRASLTWRRHFNFNEKPSSLIRLWKDRSVALK